MNYIIVFAIILFSSLKLSAQTPPTKGYYSIYNYANKLKQKQVIKSDSNSQAYGQFPAKISKGYYSINSQHRPFNKLPNEATAIEEKPVSDNLVPRVTKGYYSIGNNAAKLPTQPKE